jgi:hypothetical protein
MRYTVQNPTQATETHRTARARHRSAGSVR